MLQPITVDTESGHVHQQLRMSGITGFFGNSLLFDASAVRMAADGTLAGITFETWRELTEDGPFAHKLIFLLGQVRKQRLPALCW